MPEEKISFSDWEKIDLRTATIKEAKQHPNADKLFILQVDLGDETRQLVAGLKRHYTPEELIGKRIVILANLEPKPLRGEMSNGMILAAVTENQEQVVLLTTDKEVPNNTKIM